MIAEEIFSTLGFNGLEAEVYVALLKQGPQTAYKIAKSIGKSNANVYKAVEVLAREGAIEIMETDVKICKAIPIENVVKQMQLAYKQKLEKAVEVLSKIYEEKNDEGIFRLQTPESVFQRAEQILSKAESIVVIDAFPNALNKIKDQINALAKNGIEVFVLAYAPIELDEKVSLIVPQISGEVLEYWEAEQLNIAVDGKEVLVALFNKDLYKLIQATYSNNVYLSCILYSGIISEHKVHRFTEAKTMEEINSIKTGQKFFLNSNVPGLNQLFKQYKRK